MSRGRRFRSTGTTKQKAVGKDKDDFPHQPSYIDFSPDSDVQNDLVLFAKLIDRLAAAGGIPDARRGDLVNFLIRTHESIAIEQFNFSAQRTRKQLISEFQKKSVAAKNLVQGLETLLPEMQDFEKERTRREKYGGQVKFTSQDEALAFIQDYEESDNEVENDVAASKRLARRIADTIGWLEAEPETGAELRKKLTSAKPIEKYLATAVFAFWTKRLGREARVTKQLVAFADHVYRDMGYTKKRSTIEKQLHDVSGGVRDARKASAAARRAAPNKRHASVSH
jgi:hypothetical protein